MGEPLAARATIRDAIMTSSLIALPGCFRCDCSETYDGPSPTATCKCGHTVSEHSPIAPLNFSDVKDELDGALIFMSNALERNWPTKVGDADAAGIILAHYRVCWYTFKALRFLTADQIDGFRMPEFFTAGPPLVRSLLDALANVVYLLQDDVTARAREFIERGFSEDRFRAIAHRKHYGANPAWSEYLDELTSEETRVRTGLGLSNSQVASMTRFPTLNRMIKGKDKIADPARRKFIEYLDAWFYREFSQDAHLSAPGLYRRAGLLGVESRFWGNDEREKHRRMIGYVVMSAIGLMLGVASEIEARVRLGVQPRLVALWTRLSHNSMTIWDLYRQRYLALLV